MRLAQSPLARTKHPAPSDTVAVVDEQVWWSLPVDSPTYQAARRALDLVVTISLAPIIIAGIAILALIVRLDSPGPVIFRQKRIGKDGRLFTFYKFRTMWVDARRRYPDLYRYQYTPDEVATMKFKIQDDPRVTRAGQVLRKLSVDELPNFINVLRGDMTLVGPRPEIPEMAPYYTREQRAKFAVKPGITGLAQISGRGLLTLQATIAYDVEYVRRRSFWLDIMILARTLYATVVRLGAF
ncbi:MAG: sugar transferase [Dehalococcoidia bacterium]